MATQNARGQYGSSSFGPAPANVIPSPPPHFATFAQMDSPRPALAPLFNWDDPALQRRWAMSTLGAVAGAVLWKEHRVWGFILGSMGGGAVGSLVFPSTR